MRSLVVRAHLRHCSRWLSTGGLLRSQDGDADGSAKQTEGATTSPPEQQGWISRVLSGPKGAADATYKQSHSSMLADRDDVFELATHRIKPGELNHYLAAYEQYAADVQHKVNGLELAGSWTVAYGAQDEAVHLWRFVNGYDTADRQRARVSHDKELSAAVDEHSKLCSTRHNVLMRSFSFWALPKPRPPTHVYDLRSYVLKPGTMIDWANSWSKGITYRRDFNQDVGGFFSQAGGRLYMVFHIWAYENLAARKQVREHTWSKPGWDICVANTVQQIRTMESKIMVPTSFSPMQ